MPKSFPNDASDFDAYHRVTTRSDAPFWERHLRPHRSLSNAGFAATFLIAAGALTIPLLAFLGTYALWVLLPYAAAAVAALWYFIRRSDRDGQVCEHIRIWPDLISVHRQNPRTKDQFWMANPYWVEPRIRDTSKVQKYLTLRGNGREIELGAFLSAQDRTDLMMALQDALADPRCRSGQSF